MNNEKDRLPFWFNALVVIFAIVGKVWLSALGLDE